MAYAQQCLVEVDDGSQGARALLIEDGTSPLELLSGFINSALDGAEPGHRQPAVLHRVAVALGGAAWYARRRWLR